MLGIRLCAGACRWLISEKLWRLPAADAREAVSFGTDLSQGRQLTRNEYIAIQTYQVKSLRDALPASSLGICGTSCIPHALVLESGKPLHFPQPLGEA